MWSHFTFWMSGIHYNIKIPPKATSPAVVPIFSEGGEHFIYRTGRFQTVLGNRTGSKGSLITTEDSDNRGKTGRRPTLKADRRSQSPPKKQTSIMFHIALSWTLCFLRQSEGSCLISAHILFSNWVKHCLDQKTCWTLVLFFLLGSCLVLPDQAELKQKSPVLKKEDCPQWKHLFVFDVTPAQLQQSCLHLTLWDQSTFGSHDQFLGGAKLGASKFFITKCWR